MAKKVWHIFRFRQRFELPEDIRYDRKSPLQYTKDFVGSGNDDESCNYFNQIMALRAKSNYHCLRGIFSDLKNIAANKSKEYRGYLLTGSFEPASAREIGRWLGLSETKTKKILDVLSDVGLIEMVDLPNFNGKPRKKTGGSKKTRARTGKNGKSRGPLKKKVKANVNTKSKSKVKTKTKTNGNGKGMSQDKIKDGTYKQSADVKPQGRSAASAAPPSAPPLEPQVSAQQGRVIRFAAPAELENTKRIGDIAGDMLHRYNPHARRFAEEIYRALELPWDIGGRQAAREMGTFASAWHRVDIPPPGCDQLWERAVDEARKIARRKQNRKKGAVWLTVFKGLEMAYKQRNYGKAK